MLNAPSSLKHALSTIKSPVPPEVIVFFEDRDHDYWGTPLALHQFSLTDGIEIARKRHMLFGALREMYEVRNIRLALHANCVRHVGEWVARELERIVAKEQAEGGFNNLSPQPIVTSGTSGSIRSINEAYDHHTYPGLTPALKGSREITEATSYSHDHRRYFL